MTEDQLDLAEGLADHPADRHISRPPFSTVVAGARRRSRQRARRQVAAMALASVIVAVVTNRLVVEHASRSEGISPAVAAALQLNLVGPSEDPGLGPPSAEILDEPSVGRRTLALADPADPGGRVAVVQTEPVEGSSGAGPGVALQLESGTEARLSRLASGGSRVVWLLGSGHRASVVAIGLSDEELLAVADAVRDPSEGGGSVIDPVAGLGQLDPTGPAPAFTRPVALPLDPDPLYVDLRWQDEPSVLTLVLRSGSYDQFVLDRLANEGDFEQVGGREVWVERSVDGLDYLTWWEPSGVMVTVASVFVDGDTLERFVGGIQPLRERQWAGLVDPSEVIVVVLDEPGD